ncbi:hypothetical protein ANRL1_02826 [Anaerolineae bacterium]|nr:hypothetical protein ANRL1_02826 [Anaerolineae bacterium]
MPHLKYSWNRYATGQEIKLGDRILVANVDPGVITGVYGPGSKDAFEWGMPDGCIVYETDTGIRYTDHGTSDAMRVDLVFVKRKESNSD